MRKNVLIIPGFRVDTYTQIERSYIDLCRGNTSSICFIWLVADIKNKYNRYNNNANKNKLDLPVYVQYLKKYEIPFVVGNISKYNIISNFILFFTIFKTHEIHAVYTHFGFERFYAAFFGKILGKTVIWNEHWNSLGTKYIFLKKVFYRCFVDYFISVSSFISSQLHFKDKVCTLHQSISMDTQTDKVEPTAVRNKLNIDMHKKIVLMVADFLPEKRHDIALKVCKGVREVYPDVLFVFLGDGTSRKTFIKEIAELGLSKDVMAPGHVENVNEYYRIADICMLTSIGEAFGLVILEAFKNALPVIAFQSGGPGEIIKDGYSGILVPEGDIHAFSNALLDLLNKADVCRFLGSNAYDELLRFFNRSHWKKELIGKIEQICIGRGLMNEK